MEDPHRQPGDRDRDAVSARVRRVHASGRIGDADRDIRLANVRSAMSMAELDLMSRELDQLEGAYAAPAQPTNVAPSAPYATPYSAAPRARRRGGSSLVVVVLVLVVFLAGAGAAVVVGVRALRDAVDSDGRAGSAGGGPAYSLSEQGVSDFLEAYRERWGTSRVMDLTMFEDYVVVNVPVRGGKRQEGWVYREASGFTGFGGVRASFPGSVPVDTDRLDVAALMRNIDRARRVLKVEDPSQTYVIVRFIRGAERVPSVDIHVANEFGETGYLATTLRGKVERAYPYGG